MPEPFLPDFNHWSALELQRAEEAAVSFFNDNIDEIAQTFEKRLNLMRYVNTRMKGADMCFEERMVCLSMIQELSQGLEESAREFFEIGCQPSVARLVHPPESGPRPS